MPAPRNPINAMRVRRPDAPDACPNNRDSATRARCSSPSLRSRSRSRISAASGDASGRASTRSASGQSSAMATCRSTRIDALPTPDSRFARWRSDTPASAASARRVMPRRARSVRTVSPSAVRNGSLPSFASEGGCGVIIRCPRLQNCIIVLDRRIVRRLFSAARPLRHRQDDDRIRRRRSAVADSISPSTCWRAMRCAASESRTSTIARNCRTASSRRGRGNSRRRCRRRDCGAKSACCCSRTTPSTGRSPSWARSRRASCPWRSTRC